MADGLGDRAACDGDPLAFLANHLTRAAAIDFFVVPTATFRALYVFVVLAHERRRIVHCNVTDAPCASWTGQQVINAFPDETAPRYLHRDRDVIYGSELLACPLDAHRTGSERGALALAEPLRRAGHRQPERLALKPGDSEVIIGK